MVRLAGQASSRNQMASGEAPKAHHETGHRMILAMSVSVQADQMEISPRTRKYTELQSNFPALPRVGTMARKQ